MVNLKMNAEANRVIHDLRVGDFKLTHHAQQRMAERGVTEADIMKCAETTKSVEDQGGNTYRISGYDLAGDQLDVVAGWDEETVVITVIGD